MEVHRCKFFEWMPSAVCAMAYHPELPMLAIGRENGNIEFWNTEEKWFCESVISGHENLSIRSLIWTNAISNSEHPFYKYRLFGAGLQGQLFEINLHRLCVEVQSDSYGGPVWMMQRNPNNDTVACACEDGSLRLFDLSGERVTYLRSIQMCKARLVSCGWSKDGSMIACGSGANDVYVYHLTTSQTDSLRVSQMRGEPTIIWCVLFLSSSLIATGDSRGSVQIWDISKRIMIRIFKAHEGDVLTLSLFSYVDAQSSREAIPSAILVSGGVDAKLCVFSKIIGSYGSRTRWEHSATYRSHTHDILCSAVTILSRNASALYLTLDTKSLYHQLDDRREHHSKRIHHSDTSYDREESPSTKEDPVFRGVRDNLSMLTIISGGADGNIVVYNLEGRLESLTFRLLGCPAFYNPAVVARSHHCLLQSDHEVELIRLGESTHALQGTMYASTRDKISSNVEQLARGFQSLVRISLEGGRNSHCVDLAEEETINWILVADSSQIKLFRFDSSNLTVEHIKIPAGIRDFRCVSAKFVRLHSLCILAVDSAGKCVIFSVEGEREFQRSLFSDEERPPVSSVLIADVDEAAEKVWLIITTFCHGVMLTELDVANDSFHVSPLPSPSLPITAMTVVKSEESVHFTATSLVELHSGKWNLIVAYSDNSIGGFDLEEQKVNREFNLATYRMPRDMVRAITPISNITFLPQERVLILANRDLAVAYTMCNNRRIDSVKDSVKQLMLDMRFERIDRLLDENRFRELNDKADCGLDVTAKKIANYSNIICFLPMGEKEMLLVERHFLDIAASLPKVVYRKRYGL